MDSFMNRIRFEAERVQNLKAPTRLGTISSYDQANYAVKVMLQPDGTETGFIPFGANMVGNGWGVFFAPSPGDQVAVTFQEDGHEVPLAAFAVFDNKNRPLTVPSGEMWLVHQSGAFIKLLTNGNVEISSPNLIAIDAGTVNIGSGSFLQLVNSAFEAVYNAHTHEVTAVGSPTSPPLIGGQMLASHLTTNTLAS